METVSGRYTGRLGTTVLMTVASFLAAGSQDTHGILCIGFTWDLDSRRENSPLPAELTTTALVHQRWNEGGSCCWHWGGGGGHANLGCDCQQHCGFGPNWPFLKSGPFHRLCRGCLSFLQLVAHPVFPLMTLHLCPFSPFSQMYIFVLAVCRH